MLWLETLHLPLPLAVPQPPTCVTPVRIRHSRFEERKRLAVLRDVGMMASSWDGASPRRLRLAAELRESLLQAVDALPPAQRAVITLRDLVGVSPEEVCELPELSDGNQRVLLHRARARVRTALTPLVEVNR